MSQQNEIEQEYTKIEQNFQIIFSVLTLKQLHHWGLGGFIANLKKIQKNKWDLIKIKVKDEFCLNIQLKLKSSR